MAVGFSHFFRERARIAERQKIIESITLLFFASNLLVWDLLEGNLDNEERKEVSPEATPTCRYQMPAPT